MQRKHMTGKIKRMVSSLLVISVLTEAAGAGSVFAAKADDKAVYPVTEITVPAASFQELIGEAETKTEVYEEQNVTVVQLPSEGSGAVFSVNVAEGGLYRLQISYKCQTKEDSLSPVDVNIAVDGKLLAENTNELKLERVWTYVDGTSLTNGLMPEQTASAEWQQEDVYDSRQMDDPPVYLELAPGPHEITLYSYCEDGFDLREMKLYNPAAARPYHEVLEEQTGDGNDADFYLCVEAEEFSCKSDSIIFPENDPSDPATTLNCPEMQYYNYIAGSRYKDIGQWIEWEFDIPKDGYYCLDIRARQSEKNGLFATRRLLIDRAVPFAECEDIRFPYSEAWYIKELGEGGEPYQFFFAKGRHTLRLEVVAGVLYDTYAALSDAIIGLNGLYRKIVSVTGLTPDKYRTYDLDSTIPELDEELGTLLSVLREEKARIEKLNDGGGSELSNLQSLISLMERFQEDAEKIPDHLSTYRGYVESLAAWNAQLGTQPLDLDKIRIYSPKAQIPDTHVGFFEKIWFTIRRLMHSFFSDYTKSNDGTTGDKELGIWIGGSTEQLKTLRNMVERDYSSKTGVRVDMAIATDITSAIMAGIGPDIVLFASGEDAVRFGSHNVLVDLKEFADYSEVEKRFSPSALVPMQYDGKSYGLPLTQQWPMMFVRTDILADYGLNVPQTWDELIKAAAILQRNSIEVGIPSHTGMFLTLLMQQGGELFEEDYKTALDSQEALDAFELWTSFFAKYSFPLSYDFYNRFRSGEMAIGITEYTTYAQLQMAAPEIKGQWAMYPLPGTRNENGEINRSVSISSANGVSYIYGLSQSITCAMLFRDTSDKEIAWDFINWFTDVEAQVTYGYNIEALLGYAGRYATANVEALQQLPWSETELDYLLQGSSQVVTVNELPGNYYISRELNNAFREVLYKGSYSVDALCRHNETINVELARKKKEFQ